MYICHWWVGCEGVWKGVVCEGVWKNMFRPTHLTLVYWDKHLWDQRVYGDNLWHVHMLFLALFYFIFYYSNSLYISTFKISAKLSSLSSLTVHFLLVISQPDQLLFGLQPGMRKGKWKKSIHHFWKDCWLSISVSSGSK